MDLSTTAGIIPRCRHCGHDLTLKLINLGLSPVPNDYVEPRRSLSIRLRRWFAANAAWYRPEIYWPRRISSVLTTLTFHRARSR
jgi:hypothetical protein